MFRLSTRPALVPVLVACVLGSPFLGSLVGVDSRLRAECPVADVVRADDRPTRDGRDGTTADRRSPADVDVADMPVAPFALHEWGIWRLDRRGRIATLADLVRESPAFVHRAADADGPALTLPSRGPASLLETCDKPVIFLHAGATMDVELTVRFSRGRPWLHYPEATVGHVDGVRTVRWAGRVLADETLPEGRRYPDAPAGHWWTNLRDAHASPFVPEGGSEAERFLFYDGETELARGFRFRRRGPVPIAGRADPVAWILDDDGAARLAIVGTSMARARLSGVPALRADMRAELVRRGLTEGEVDALLDTWRSELFSGSTNRVVWMLPRSVYDAMLPLDVTPTPETLVRVGLVIERF